MTGCCTLYIQEHEGRSGETINFGMFPPPTMDSNLILKFLPAGQCMSLGGEKCRDGDIARGTGFERNQFEAPDAVARWKGGMA